MIYQVFTTLLKYKPMRLLLQRLKRGKLIKSLVPMLKEWYDKDFIFQSPSITFLGQKSLMDLSKILSYVKFNKPLIITDQILIKLGVVVEVINVLKHHKIKSIIFDGVQANPTTAVVNNIVDLYHQQGCDALISIGGGSAHDAAKAASLTLTNTKSIKKMQGINTTHNVSLMPIIAINTTAGTGSGATNVAVITDQQKHFKMTLVDKNIQPNVLVDDSDLMMKLPQKPSVWVGVDALVHAIEAELSIYSNLLSKIYARQCMHLVYKYLPTVYCDQSNKQAREKMAYAEFLGGMAFNSASLGFIHSLSHALSGMFDVPHGLANAVIMPYVLDYEINRKNVAHQLGKIADFMGIDVLANDEFNKAKETIQKIANFLKNLGIPHTLSELQLQITKKQIRKMSLHAMKDFCGISNPVQFSRREVKHIYQNAINGSFENI